MCILKLTFIHITKEKEGDISVGKDKKYDWKEVGLIAAGLIAVTFIALFITNKTTSDKEIRALHNRVAEVAELQRYEGDRIASDVAMMQNTITTQNQTLRKLRRDISYYTKVSVGRDSIRIVYVTEPSEEMGINIWPIVWSGEGVNIDGSFITPDGVFDARLDFEPIDLKIYLTQDDIGVWETFVEPMQDYLTINSIKSEVKPFKTRKQHFYIMLGSFYGSAIDGYRFGGNFSFGYRGLGFQVNVDRFGIAYGIQKVWRF